MLSRFMKGTLRLT
ncbi:hypothetical protein QN277_000662 [Acacia crassicarpa]|uniref:Uncharacterized protein n=1 Tax=Acacia crassicarpa TaxID=499986 RepID=A0AAE1N5H4_9FABA|nr:hypothetical protein QN277_000662 [Acacia crassicarpa]